MRGCWFSFFLYSQLSAFCFFKKSDIFFLFCISLVKPFLWRWVEGLRIEFEPSNDTFASNFTQWYHTAHYEHLVPCRHFLWNCLWRRCVFDQQNSVIKIVREKYLNTTAFSDKEKLQAFLSELYVFLIDQMHVALNKVIWYVHCFFFFVNHCILHWLHCFLESEQNSCLGT